MADGTDGAVLRQFDRLYNGGSVAGLAEGQLLDRFVHRRDEVAFEAIVSRYGPMVLGVCRRTLNDPHEVEDAFQATFLVLVRRAGSIRDRALLGNWLYGVALKVSRRARSRALKRRARETRAFEADRLAGPPPIDPGQGELRGAIDQEIAALPGPLRQAVVLCYLEGCTHDEAARRLNWPVGTVRSRLARARRLLQGRLSRRGLAPTAGSAIASALSLLAAERAASSVVPPKLLEETVRAATLFAAGRAALIAAGTVPASAVALATGTLRSALMTKLMTCAGLAVLTAGLATGIVAARQEPADPASGAVPAALAKKARGGASNDLIAPDPIALKNSTAEPVGTIVKTDGSRCEITAFGETSDIHVGQRFYMIRQALDVVRPELDINPPYAMIGLLHIRSIDEDQLVGETLILQPGQSPRAGDLIAPVVKSGVVLIEDYANPSRPSIPAKPTDPEDGTVKPPTRPSVEIRPAPSVKVQPPPSSAWSDALQVIGKVTDLDLETNRVEIDAGSDDGIRAGERYLIVGRDDANRLRRFLGMVEIVRVEPKQSVALWAIRATGAIVQVGDVIVRSANRTDPSRVEATGPIALPEPYQPAENFVQLQPGELDRMRLEPRSSGAGPSARDIERVTNEAERLRRELAAARALLRRLGFSAEREPARQMLTDLNMTEQEHLSDVIRVEDEQRIIDLSAGADDGIERGQEFFIVRYEPGSAQSLQVLGLARVVSTYPDRSTAEMVTRFLDAPIEVGDSAVPVQKLGPRDLEPNIVEAPESVSVSPTPEEVEARPIEKDNASHQDEIDGVIESVNARGDTVLIRFEGGEPVPEGTEFDVFNRDRSMYIGRVRMVEPTAGHSGSSAYALVQTKVQTIGEGDLVVSAERSGIDPNDPSTWPEDGGTEGFGGAGDAFGGGGGFGGVGFGGGGGFGGVGFGGGGGFAGQGGFMGGQGGGFGGGGRVGDGGFGGENQSTQARTISTGGLIAVLSPDRSKVWAYPKLRQNPSWLSFEAPEGVTINPVMGQTVLALGFEGGSITEIAAMGFQTDAWNVLPLTEPAEGELFPVVSDNLVTYTVGNHVYAYSGKTNSWDVLTVSDKADVQPAVGLEAVTVVDGDRLHVFSASGGTWESIDTTNGAPAPEPKPVPEPQAQDGAGSIDGGSDVEPAAAVETPEAPTRPPGGTGADRTTSRNEPNEGSFTTQGDFALVLSPDRSTIHAYPMHRDNASWATYKAPKGVTISPMMTGSPMLTGGFAQPVTPNAILSLGFTGETVTEIAAISSNGQGWNVRALEEPAEGTEMISPVVHNDAVVYRIGRYAYGYSGATDSWDVIELGEPTGPDLSVQLMGMMSANPFSVIGADGRSYVFNANRGQWLTEWEHLGIPAPPGFGGEGEGDSKEVSSSDG